MYERLHEDGTAGRVTEQSLLSGCGDGNHVAL